MNRRPFLRALATGSALLTTGCTESLPFAADGPTAADVFADHRFDGTDLVVEFRDGVEVESAVLFDSSTDEEFETVERPAGAARFPVVFPDRLETYVARALYVKAETPDGRVRRRIPETVHGYVEGVEVLDDGRARFEVENQGEAPLLVRFVGISGDVPNPAVDVQADSFDASWFDLGPGVVGVGRNRTLSSSRTDLVVSPGEVAPFETTYAPFAFPDGADAADCGGDERTAEIAVLHASGGSAAYTFTYRLDGEPTAVAGESAVVCGGADAAGGD
ncbi:hypothetical protein M0R89_14110 [Halorussus limi]|uniref:Uncharacterized protein n=1 Tax=Halorussus limi TaxID=2938695 RepID=A0A8U0HS22_9EURY|nr:hypothetical protein [Halorussus limi]UPV73668.1 hypothetical protein M0R89_14110 [Halorussus limi]